MYFEEIHKTGFTFNPVNSIFCINNNNINYIKY